MNQLSQITNRILMVRPSSFGSNPETIANNAFQHSDTNDDSDLIKKEAIKEFDAFTALLQSKGIEVVIIQDTPEPLTTDAVFPNNWISFHQGKTIITYPMFSPMRRKERRLEIVEQMMQYIGYQKHIELKEWEEQDLFLEGTGSMILDRVHRIAYACRSTRTDEKVFLAFCEKMNFEPILFDALDKSGMPIYHTNVMMAMGDKFVVICMDSIPSQAEKENLLQQFANTQKELIEITLDQVYAFAGNMLQVQARDTSYLIMSDCAHQSLTASQIQKIEKFTQILSTPIPTIEKYGGGGVRCMMAELF